MSNKMNPNPNDAASDKWRLTFQGIDLILFSQKVIGFDIPDVSATGMKGPSPDPILSDFGSDRLEIAPAQFVFVVDENYDNYKLLFQWMRDNTNRDIKETRDFFIDLLNNRGQSQNVALQFEKGRPTNLGSFTLDTTGETPILLCTLTMNFQDMNFV